jgi:hypothetical protein
MLEYQTPGNQQRAERTPKMADLQYANTACPYCAAALDPLPKAKKKCPACRRTVYVRVGPDAMVYLLRDVDRPVLEQAWAEFRAEQEWRRQALELVDEASLARIESEMRAVDPRCTNRDVYWAIATRAVRNHTRTGNWPAVKAAYVRMALTAWDEAGSGAVPNDSARLGSRSRARRLLRQARTAELRGLGSSPGVTTVTVLAGCCPACDRSANIPRRLAQEVVAPVLPHSHCQRGLCRCEYVIAGTGGPATLRA